MKEPSVATVSSVAEVVANVGAVVITLDCISGLLASEYGEMIDKENHRKDISKGLAS